MWLNIRFIKIFGKYIWILLFVTIINCSFKWEKDSYIYKKSKIIVSLKYYYSIDLLIVINDQWSAISGQRLVVNDQWLSMPITMLYTAVICYAHIIYAVVIYYTYNTIHNCYSICNYYYYAAFLYDIILKVQS